MGELSVYSSNYMLAASDAILAQNVSNASGILNALERARVALIERKHFLAQGTEWFNRHPILYLFSVQLSYLSGACALADGDYRKATEICEKISAGEFVEGY